MNSIISQRTSSIRGLSVSSSLWMPVSSTTLSLTVIPGLISVEYVSFTSPCSILAMPISIILSLAGLRPVVSRSSAI